MTYGSEAWVLDRNIVKALRGANARMLARIIRREIQEEASASTTTFDVVMWIRTTCLKGLGHLSRLPAERLVHQAAKHIYDNRQTGDLLVDAPPTTDWDELLKMAADRINWRTRVHKLKKAAKERQIRSEAKREPQRTDAYTQLQHEIAPQRQSGCNESSEGSGKQ